MQTRLASVKRQIVHLKCLHCCSGKIKDKKEKIAFKPQSSISQQSEFFEVQYKSGLRLFFLLLGLCPSYY